MHDAQNGRPYKETSSGRELRKATNWTEEEAYGRDGIQLRSYRTCVASIEWTAAGPVGTRNGYWSVTTSKHTNKFFRRHGLDPDTVK